MAKANAVTKAEQLVAQERLAEAREMLLDAGYVARLDPEAQAAYEKLIPAGETLKKHLAGAFDQLRASGAPARLKAAKWLSREALKAYSRDRKEWMGDPRATGPLIAALDDEDQKVVAEAATALAMIIVRYFRDLRAFPALARLLQNPQKEVRLFAARAIGYLGHKDRWTALLPLLQDGVAKVRNEICLAVMGAARRGELGSADKKKLLRPLIAALDDDDGEVRRAAANAILDLRDAAALPALEQQLAKEKDREIKANLKRVVAVLGGAPDPYAGS